MHEGESSEALRDVRLRAEKVASRATPRSAASRARRERIRQAAARLFVERGFAKTPVEEIAVAAGVSKGLIYVHFESKDALLAAVLDRAVSDWVRTTLKASSQAPSPMGSIVEGLRASLAYACEDAILRGILVQDLRAVWLPVRRRERSRLIRGYIRWIRQHLYRARERAEIRSDADLDRVAEVIWMIHDGLVRRIASFRDTEERAEFALLVDAAVELLLSGLSAGAHAGSP